MAKKKPTARHSSLGNLSKAEQDFYKGQGSYEPLGGWPPQTRSGNVGKLSAKEMHDILGPSEEDQEVNNEIYDNYWQKDQAGRRLDDEFEHQYMMAEQFKEKNPGEQLYGKLYDEFASKNFRDVEDAIWQKRTRQKAEIDKLNALPPPTEVDILNEIVLQRDRADKAASGWLSYEDFLKSKLGLPPPYTR